jgi:thiol-disulfide isomerase/thioredoxin
MTVKAYYFWSPTCGPCKVIRPNVEELRGVFSSTIINYINIYEDRQGLSEQFQVRVVPTMVVVATDAEGKVVYTGKHSGTDMLGYYRILRIANQQPST